MLARDLLKAWSLVDLLRLSETLGPYTDAVWALATSYGQASGTVAARFYQEEREAAKLGRGPRPSVSAPPTRDVILAALKWATKDLWTNPHPDVPAAQTLAAGAVQQSVLGVGRATLAKAIESDRQAVGWARQARSNACAFCLMLATRGAVYKSEATASVTLSGEKYHGHCHCIPSPIFRGQTYTDPPHILAAASLYTRSTTGVTGSAEKRNAFRTALADYRT